MHKMKTAQVSIIKSYNSANNMMISTMLSFSLFMVFFMMFYIQQVHAEAASSGTGKIVKWKDDKGVTHYGDSVPAQYSSRENSVMSKQGITVQRNKAVNYQDIAIDQAKQEQDKKDKALLSAFTNENEIDLARDRNLQLDQVTVEGLQLQNVNSQKRLSDNQKYADSLSKRKKVIPAELSADIKANQAEIALQNQQIAARKASMAETRQRFDDDKKRFILLKNRDTESASASRSPLQAKH